MTHTNEKLANYRSEAIAVLNDAQVTILDKVYYQLIKDLIEEVQWYRDITVFPREQTSGL